MIVVIGICPRTFLSKSLFQLTGLLALGHVLFTNAYAIDVLQIQLDDIEAESFSAKNLLLEIDIANPHKVSLHLLASNISTPYLKNNTSISANCQNAKLTGQTINCIEGIVKLEHPLIKNEIIPFTFQYHMINGLQKVDINTIAFSGGKLDLKAEQINDRWLFDVNMHEVDMPILWSSIETKETWLENYPIEKGILNLESSFKLETGSVSEARMSIAIKNISMDAEQVLDKVTLTTNLTLKKESEHWIFNNELDLQKGAAYIIPGFQVFDDMPGFFLDLQEQSIQVLLQGIADTESQSYQINSFQYHQGDLLNIEGQGAFYPEQDNLVESLSLSISSGALQKVFPVYIQPILLPTNFADLELSGSLAIDLTHEKNQLKSLQLDLNDIFIDDEFSRFSVSGLNSNIHLKESEKLQQSRVGWQGMSIYKILLGPGDMLFESRGSNYTVKEWQDVDILDGVLTIRHLSLLNLGQKGFEMQLDGELKPVSLSSFTQTMGWPLMSGKLAGEISGFHYSNNHLSLGGDLVFHVFNGDITLSNFKVDNLFSNYSRLSTDVNLQNLDLEQITDTFTFGKIEGTLEGRMDKFTLEDWQPVYFDAEFITPEKDEKPHRISQKALDNLSELGGGLTGSLSRGFLKFIPEYSYGRLGIRCLLNNGVCNLGGVHETEDGFYILTRGGLFPPWVAVKGTGRSISWHDLIEGFKQIAEGEIAFE